MTAFLNPAKKVCVKKFVEIINDEYFNMCSVTMEKSSLMRNKTCG